MLQHATDCSQAKGGLWDDSGGGCLSCPLGRPLYSVPHIGEVTRVKRVMYILLGLILLAVLLKAPAAQADWRWADPKFKVKFYAVMCDTPQCVKAAKNISKQRHRRKIRSYHKRKLREWNLWTSRYIPDCTWYGESGHGPKYARVRYVTPNSGGSGAYGKFQFMPSTYHSVAKYGDWSPLDQEIAARREYWRNGTSPWTNCG